MRVLHIYVVHDENLYACACGGWCGWRLNNNLARISFFFLLQPCGGCFVDRHTIDDDLDIRPHIELGRVILLLSSKLW